jgi:hypothetical protein
MLAACLEGLLGEDVVVGTHGLTMDHGALLAKGSFLERLGRRGKEDARIVSQDAGQDHDDGDGHKDPVAMRNAGVSVVLVVGGVTGRRRTYKSWGSRWICWSGNLAMMKIMRGQRQLVNAIGAARGRLLLRDDAAAGSSELRRWRMLSATWSSAKAESAV